MANSMIILGPGGRSRFNTCPCCPPIVRNVDKSIPKFYSPEHAYDEGWRWTTHWKYSPGGRGDWICPDCWKEEGTTMFAEDIEDGQV